MKGYKGFYPGLICEPDSEHKKQYAENTVYEEDKAECCRSGMHFCKYPLDVFGYYPPVTDKGVSEYAEVEALDKPVTDDEGNRQLKTVKCHKVDGKTVKPDTWYMLKNGKFAEVK